MRDVYAMHLLSSSNITASAAADTMQRDKSGHTGILALGRMLALSHETFGQAGPAVRAPFECCGDYRQYRRGATAPLLGRRHACACHARTHGNFVLPRRLKPGSWGRPHWAFRSGCQPPPAGWATPPQWPPCWQSRCGHSGRLATPVLPWLCQFAPLSLPAGRRVLP